MRVGQFERIELGNEDAPSEISGSDTGDVEPEDQIGSPLNTKAI